MSLISFQILLTDLQQARFACRSALQVVSGWILKIRVHQIGPYKSDHVSEVPPGPLVLTRCTFGSFVPGRWICWSMSTCILRNCSSKVLQSCHLKFVSEASPLRTYYLKNLTHVLIMIAPFLMSRCAKVSWCVNPGTGSRKLGSSEGSEPKAHLNRSKRPSFIMLCAFFWGLPSGTSTGTPFSLSRINLSTSKMMRVDSIFLPARKNLLV
jgi:hypothetical protein